jgi:hypothetical protein
MFFRAYIGYIELVTDLSTMHWSISLWQPGHSSSSPIFISAPQCMQAVHDETFSSAIMIKGKQEMMIFNNNLIF